MMRNHTDGPVGGAMMEARMTIEKIHRFEEAGLGKAPFRIVDFHVSKWAAAPGGPALPGSTCDYCGTPIMNVYTIQSADGHKFEVGCDCVAKTGDAGLKKQVTAEQRKARYKAQERERESQWAQVRAAKGRLESVRYALSLQPHPSITGLSLLDYITWMFTNAGLTGQLKVARIIEKTEPVAAPVSEQPDFEFCF